MRLNVNLGYAAHESVETQLNALCLFPSWLSPLDWQSKRVDRYRESGALRIESATGIFSEHAWHHIVFTLMPNQNISTIADKIDKTPRGFQRQLTFNVDDPFSRQFHLRFELMIGYLKVYAQFYFSNASLPVFFRRPFSLY